MTVISVNSFNDAPLLRGALASVREQLPHARIQVVDGRYEAFPAPEDNSTDATSQVCDAYGAEYYPDGPHEDEPTKHWARIERAPDGERVLFLDADERLVEFDDAGFDDQAIYRIRIHQPACYNGATMYYARYFYPEQMDDIPRVDRFWFGDHKERRTDAITITHRADLRGGAYRAAKNVRLQAEGREWYDAYLDEFDADELAFETCPECGRESLRVSRVCGHDGTFTRVETCVAEDRCHAAVVPIDGPTGPDEFRYVPDALERGFEEDLERVRMELMVAGDPIAQAVSGEAFRRYEPNAKLWVEHEYLGDGLS